MATSVVSVSDGGRITVADMVANPLWIPSKLAELMQNQFISEGLFRNGGSNPNGVVAYRESDPMFLDDDVQDVAEFGEIPVSAGQRGVPRVAYAVKKALGIRVSKEMIDENNVGEVNRQMLALRNTFIRANDRAVKAILESSAVPTQAVSAAWDASGKPRTDIAQAIETITTVAPVGASADEYYGFVPDTIVLHPGLLAQLLDNTDLLRVYQGNIADQNIAYTGALPSRIFGLDVVQSRTFPITKVLILQRGVIGFYSDTRPLQFTGLYPEGNGPNGGPRETYRSDASHKRAIAADQPKAGLWLTGVVT